MVSVFFPFSSKADWRPVINQSNKEEKVLVGGGEAFAWGVVLRRRLELRRVRFL